MWALFLKGGLIMIPLGILSILGAAVFIEKILTLRRSSVMPTEVINCIEEVRNPSDIPMAIKLCERHNSPLANIVRAGMEDSASSLADIRQHMEDIGRGQVKRLERYLPVLETVATASPLLGLLGTVLGMIKVFAVISIAGVGEAGLLSGGIAEALITTAFGLGIGIPALIAYNFIDSRVENYVIQIEGYSHMLLRHLGEMKNPPQTGKVREITDAPQK